MSIQEALKRREERLEKQERFKIPVLDEAGRYTGTGEEMLDESGSKAALQEVSRILGYRFSDIELVEHEHENGNGASLTLRWGFEPASEGRRSCSMIGVQAFPEQDKIGVYRFSEGWQLTGSQWKDKDLLEDVIVEALKTPLKGIAGK